MNTITISKLTYIYLAVTIIKEKHVKGKTQDNTRRVTVLGVLISFISQILSQLLLDI